MTNTITVNSEHFSVAESEALLKHKGDIKLSVNTAEPAAVAKLAEFGGSSLHITISLKQNLPVLLTLAEALATLHERTGIDILLEPEDIIDFDLPVEFLGLFRFINQNMAFYGTDFRHSDSYWPPDLGSGFYSFYNCHWDVQALDALQKCGMFGALFTIADQPESIVRAIGRVAPSYLLQVDVECLNGTQALYWAASESKLGSYFNVVGNMTDSADWIHALSECDGWLEIYYDSLSKKQKMALVGLQAYTVKFFDLDDEDFHDLLGYMTTSSVTEVIVEEVGTINAALARLIVAWAEGKHSRGNHGGRLFLEGGSLTRCAKQIIEESVSEFTELKVTPACVTISLFE